MLGDYDQSAQQGSASRRNIGWRADSTGWEQRQWFGVVE